jgi:RNA polymerase sigma-70 factor (ECF subfamily)
MVGDPSLAEDIAQEAMTRAWRHAETYDPRRGSVATWLLTITRHLSIDSLRLRRPEPIDPDSLLGLKTPASALAPDKAAVSADEGARVRAALAELPLDQRRAVVLAAFQGHTAKEISAVEGIPLGTAKTRIRLGILRLRAIMIREVGEDAPS